MSEGGEIQIWGTVNNSTTGEVIRHTNGEQEHEKHLKYLSVDPYEPKQAEAWHPFIAEGLVNCEARLSSVRTQVIPRVNPVPPRIYYELGRPADTH